MNKRERIMAALNHHETDIVPFHADFTSQAHKRVSDHLNDSQFINNLDLHLNYVQYWGWPTELSTQPEHFKDEFGVIWNRSGADKDIGVVQEYVIDDIENLTYKFPKVNAERLRKEYEELMKRKNDCFTFGGIGFSMFERSWSLMGMENVLMAMITNPDELEKLYDDICEYNLKVMDIALEYELDGFYFGDDWGQQKGLIMGPNNWRKFIKPRMKKMYAKAKEKGLFVIQHSCGDVESIFEDLIEIGLDCYQTFQPEIYDIAAVKQRYGDRLCFWGGISTQQCLAHATPDEVKQETIRVMKIMSKNGGYIAAPTHALEFDVQPENIIAMFEVFKNQSIYLK